MASHGVPRTAAAAVRSEEARQKELHQIEAYKELVELVNTKIAERQYTLEVLASVTTLLNQNPEYYTIWNHRRRILGALMQTPATKGEGSGGEDLLLDDLQLTFSLLRKYPKCYWIWNHRNWILRTAEKSTDLDRAHHLWSGELQLVGKMLQADSRNFHAWDYRRFVVAQLERLDSSRISASEQVDPTVVKWLESEFEYTTKMIKTNLSNFSAWHNRGRIIPLLLSRQGADDRTRRHLLDEELKLISTAINTDPFDQSIWYYHQYLMSTISPGCPQHRRIALDLTNHDRQKYYEHEMEYINEILEDETDCKWIYEGLLDLAASYLEVDGGTKAFTTRDMRSWLEQLERLDPLRCGRWRDLRQKLNI
ncbi:geranylgeranyl transferas-like protein type II alpha subunit [Sporormia fimetaria CBS 119925]|uniref:Geranylgeranyl transferase type-2 subunit alpha n=1 Tax=Sporormia fimetaria CBS 119925 TaxID=1340428 RepID=A0A6A6VFI5_9PLEO|nr:geranylgeranyl transferas-like protein type II alpha subunit [Sporormia fimetaria CBS 119925]